MYIYIYMTYTVDIVYRWLNPSVDSRSSIRQTRDNNELKYSLRSLRLLPYINKIFIIGKGTPPQWLDLHTNKHLYWIDESAICSPLRSQIPYDSEYAKYIVHMIEELGEYFIMMDDDYYIGKHIPFEYWFKEATYPIWPSKVYMSHCPIPMRKTLYKEAMDRIDIHDGSCRIKLSDNDRYYSFKLATRPRFAYDPLICMKVYLSTSHKIELMDRDHILITSKRKHAYPNMIKHSTYCINDIWSNDPDEYKKEMVIYDKYRATRYPYPSAYEHSH
jgi:hypothetical protein